MTPNFGTWSEATLDADGIRGTCGTHTWSALGTEGPGTAQTFRKLFGFADPTFRRLDRLGKALVLATEATGLRQRLDATCRQTTAIVVATHLGCLDTDLRFARTLDTPMPDGPAFAYTLPSACLGEVALRHGLRGPSLCLSTPDRDHTTAIKEGLALLSEGLATHALVATVEVLLEPHPQTPPTLFAQATLLGPALHNQSG